MFAQNNDALFFPNRLSVYDCILDNPFKNVKKKKLHLNMGLQIAANCIWQSFLSGVSCFSRVYGKKQSIYAAKLAVKVSLNGCVISHTYGHLRDIQLILIFYHPNVHCRHKV